MVVAFSLLLNILIFLLIGKVFFYTGLGEDSALREHHYAGKKLGPDKIAVVRIDGVIMEGMTGYARKQIETAAADDSVKAVVVRIDSPGGTITATDDLYRRLCELRDSSPTKKTQAKPLVVSMGSVAASGGYYVAMPASKVMAERSTITGSIGVYAAFPNVSELAGKYGVKMNVIKAGRVKDSGSMFHAMSMQERRLWQDMVDHAYGQFLDVVQESRGSKLKYALVADIPQEAKPLVAEADETTVASAPAKENGRTYVRQLADGGIFTADKAQKYGLVDEIGYLDDAIASARKIAGLDDDCKVIMYERPQPLLNLLLGETAARTKLPSEMSAFAGALEARIWYLAPGNDLAGVLAAGGEAGRN
jgi:protease-4